MNEEFTPAAVSVQTADAEQVSITYRQGDLILEYIDWQEHACRVAFADTLAFRWQEYDDAVTPRDDSTYQLIHSAWLKAQTVGLTDPEQYAHYKLCFNACGVLDLLCRKIPAQA